MGLPFSNLGMVLKSLCAGSGEPPDSVTERTEQSRAAKKCGCLYVNILYIKIYVCFIGYS